MASTIPQESTKQQRGNNADHLASYHEIRRKDLSVLQQASTLPIPNLLPITQKQNFVFNSSVLLSQLQLLHAPFSVTPFCPERHGIWNTRQYSAGLQIRKEPAIQISQWDWIMSYHDSNSSLHMQFRIGVKKNAQTENEWSQAIWTRTMPDWNHARAPRVWTAKSVLNSFFSVVKKPKCNWIKNRCQKGTNILGKDGFY